MDYFYLWRLNIVNICVGILFVSVSRVLFLIHSSVLLIYIYELMKKKNLVENFQSEKFISYFYEKMHYFNIFNFNFNILTSVEMQSKYYGQFGKINWNCCFQKFFFNIAQFYVEFRGNFPDLQNIRHYISGIKTDFVYHPF